MDEPDQPFDENESPNKNGDRTVDLPNSKINSNRLFRIGVLTEGGLILLSLTLAWLGFCDSDQPFRIQSFVEKSAAAVTWGLSASIPLTIAMLVPGYLGWKIFSELNQIATSLLRPMFREFSLWEIVTLSVMAGIGEEMFFRWALQGGMTGYLGWGISLVIASTAFGLCHWVNTTYGLVTIGVGLFLGLEMIIAKTWIAPAITHALYDMIAICYLTDRLPIKFKAH